MSFAQREWTCSHVVDTAILSIWGDSAVSVCVWCGVFVLGQALFLWCVWA